MDLLQSGLQTLCDADADIHAVLKGCFDDVYTRLNRYLNEIELFNNAYSLVAYTERSELIIRHMLDSLSPLGIIVRELRNRYSEDTQSFSIADLGSGAGFPGIPLAIALPSWNFTLAERMRRRAGFLRNVQAVLGLKNLCVNETQIEQLPTAFFHVLTFRGLSPINPASVTKLSRLLKPCGFIAAYKGRKEKARAEQQSILNEHNVHLIKYTVPFLKEERHLLIVSAQ